MVKQVQLAIGIAVEVHVDVAMVIQETLLIVMRMLCLMHHQEILTVQNSMAQLPYHQPLAEITGSLRAVASAGHSQVKQILAPNLKLQLLYSKEQTTALHLTLFAPTAESTSISQLQGLTLLELAITTDAIQTNLNKLSSIPRHVVTG